MPDVSPAVTRIRLPGQSILSGAYEQVDLMDSYAVSLPRGSTHDPEVLARFVFSRRARWMDLLMGTRDAIVSGLGLKTAAQLRTAGGQQERVAIFRIYRITEQEILLGEDDSHLDFRLSVLCLPGREPQADGRLVLSTVVCCHNALGRIYLTVITPFHRLIVRSILGRAARSGWPALD